MVIAIFSIDVYLVGQGCWNVLQIGVAKKVLTVQPVLHLFLKHHTRANNIKEEVVSKFRLFLKLNSPDLTALLVLVSWAWE